MTGDVVSIDALLAGIWDGVHGVGGAYDPARRMPPLPRFLLSRQPRIWINLMDGLVSEKAVAVTYTPRIAVACSGLGHVQRGIEAWAGDLAHALNKAGVAVSLFGGAPADGVIDVPCLRRTSRRARILARLFRHVGGWHYGAGSPYEIEQATFSLALWPRIRRGFDILHVQDPLIATWFENAYRRGLSNGSEPFMPTALVRMAVSCGSFAICNCSPNTLR